MVCCCSVTKACLTLCHPMDCSILGSSVIHYFPEFAQTHVHWVSDALYLILCHPLLLLPSIFLSIRVFSNESTLCIRWPKPWSFSFSISPSNEYLGLISFRKRKSESESRSVVSESLWPHGRYSPWNSPGQNTGVGSCFLFHGIFPTQGLNSGLLHCRQILYQLSHQESQSFDWFDLLVFDNFQEWFWTPKNHIANAQQILVGDPPLSTPCWDLSKQPRLLGLHADEHSTSGGTPTGWFSKPSPHPRHWSEACSVPLPIKHTAPPLITTICQKCCQTINCTLIELLKRMCPGVHLKETLNTKVTDDSVKHKPTLSEGC